MAGDKQSTPAIAERVSRVIVASRQLPVAAKFTATGGKTKPATSEPDLRRFDDVVGSCFRVMGRSRGLGRARQGGCGQAKAWGASRQGTEPSGSLRGGRLAVNRSVGNGLPLAHPSPLGEIRHGAFAAALTGRVEILLLRVTIRRS